MKACEIRAIVELAKFLQVKLDHLYLIGIDCPGTFEVPDYAKWPRREKEGRHLTRKLLRGMEKGRFLPPSGYAFGRPARCVNIPFRQADIVLKLYGYKADQEVGVEIGEKLEKEIEEKGHSFLFRK